MAGPVLILLVALGLTTLTAVLVEKARVPVERAGVPVEKAPSPAAVGARGRADAAAALLARLEQRLRSGDRAQVVALGARGSRPARRELGTLFDNVRALRVVRLSLRYAGQDARLTATQSSTLGAAVWVADVRVRWRLGGFDAHDAVSRVPVTLRSERGRTSFVSARAGTATAVPLWLLGPVVVARTPSSLAVVTRAAAARRFSRLADRARLDVRKVLPGWRGRLVVEIPRDERTFDRVLGSRRGTYSGIAAVTSTADGSARPAAPVRIVVHPQVFGRLGPRGGQVVLSHEATHVATGATFSTMPPWLLEGFADYVALAHVDLPVRVAAGQILAEVRRTGPPGDLPGAAAFAGRTPDLGAAYESAWVACRLLAREYGERRLVAFYRASTSASSTTAAFHTVLGTSQAAFTRQWRAELRRLAG